MSAHASTRRASGARSSALQLLPGDASRLGARWDGEGVLFSVFSQHASMLELCLFDEVGNETHRLEFEAATDGIWHGYLPGASQGQRYGYRAHGAFDPGAGHYFNSQRLLLDPYARALSGGYTSTPANAVCRFDETSEQPLAARLFDQDNAQFVPKSVVLGNLPWARERTFCKPTRRVVYEAHVAGLTALNHSLPEELRGRFAGLGSKEIVAHLRSLGITSLQLLPVHTFVDEPHLANNGLTNYWGYNTLNFFTPHSAYASSQTEAHREMRALVRTLHDANIEVILDVVYNHTAEGGADGPSLCYRGLDNSNYYKLDERNGCAYINDTGCGNTLNTNSPVVHNLVLDSLRHWSEEYGIDGFRFDLAVTLGREPEGFSSTHALLEAIKTDRVLRDRILIAEPWDVGPGGYQTGGFLAPWLEWNDRFRDAARSYWRNDSGAQAELGKRLHGSSDLFESSGRKTLASVNLITAHDGFTLADLVAYEHKHNEANLEENRDGHSHNLSSNLGVEGRTTDSAILDARDRRSRALLATLLFSQGTPMLLAGDELRNSQEGNNNAYCQANQIGWIDWSHTDSAHIELVARVLDIRSQLEIFDQADHVHASWSGTGVAAAGAEIGWRRFDGAPMLEEDWHVSSDEGAAPFLLVWATPGELVGFALNPSNAGQVLVLPDGFDWQCLLDSSVAMGNPSGKLLSDTCLGRPEIPSQSFCVFYAAEKRSLSTD